DPGFPHGGNRGLSPVFFAATIRAMRALLWPLALLPATAASADFQLPAGLSWAALAIESATPPPRPAEPDFSATIEANRSYAIPAAEIVGFEFLLNQYDRRHFGCCDFDSNIHTIRRNLHSSW